MVGLHEFHWHAREVQRRRVGIPHLQVQSQHHPSCPHYARAPKGPALHHALRAEAAHPAADPLESTVVEALLNYLAPVVVVTLYSSEKLAAMPILSATTQAVQKE